MSALIADKGFLFSCFCFIAFYLPFIYTPYERNLSSYRSYTNSIADKKINRVRSILSDKIQNTLKGKCSVIVLCLEVLISSIIFVLKILTSCYTLWLALVHTCIIIIPSTYLFSKGHDAMGWVTISIGYILSAIISWSICKLYPESAFNEQDTWDFCG